MTDLNEVIVFDLETTSADVNTARIVQFAAVDLAGHMLADWRVNPGCPIPPEATEVHGITDEDVADLPMFHVHAAAGAQDLVRGRVLAGYNHRRFDVPILDRELRAAGQPGIDLERVVEIDALRVWHQLKPRTLAGALKEWCGEELRGAHDALADCRATAAVIREMAKACHPQEMPAISKPPTEVDRAGRFKRCEKTGKVVFNFGKHKGEFAALHPDYLHWISGKDFPEDTLNHARRMLGALGELP